MVFSRLYFVGSIPIFQFLTERKNSKKKSDALVFCGKNAHESYPFVVQVSENAVSGLLERFGFGLVSVLSWDFDLSTSYLLPTLSLYKTGRR